MRTTHGLWRLRAARTLAWTLLLGAWVGLGSLSMAITSGPFAALAMMALWLLALGACAESITRLPLQRWWLRGLLLCAAALAAWASSAALHGAAPVALLPALLAWAIVIALASAAVRSCRVAVRARAGSPATSAAVGAVMAWAWVGDIGDVNALIPRVMLGVLAACALLAILIPRRSTGTGGCRAGLFDCSMPGWSADAWRLPQRRAVGLASLVMLPMMCSLPWMVGLCRSDAVSPQAVVGLHFAAMFGPAVLMVRRPAWSVHAPQVCALLLMLGALLLVLAPDALAWWALALAHGTAWSVAWAAQLAEPGARASAHTSPLAGAALNALCVLALGFGISLLGLLALTGLHLAFGVGAAAVLLAAAARWRPLPPVAASAAERSR